MSSQPLQVSFDPAAVPSATDVLAAAYAAEAVSFHSSPAAVTAAPEAAAVEDTVTLSAEAVQRSLSSNLLVFTAPAVNPAAVGEKAEAVFSSEYPLQHLLDEGYSLSEIAVLFGLPREAGDTSAVAQPVDSAA